MVRERLASATGNWQQERDFLAVCKRFRLRDMPAGNKWDGHLQPIDEGWVLGTKM